MLRQHFQVENLLSVVGQRGEQAAFARAGGAADHAKRKALRQRLQFIQHVAPVGLVAAFQFVRRPADLRENDAHRAAALPAAPAVDQRAP